MKPAKLFAKLYALFCLAAVLLLCWQLPARIQTGLDALLPAAAYDAVMRAADAAHERQLNGQIVLAAGADTPEAAFAAAAHIAGQWRQSGIFAAVDAAVAPDVAQLRESAQALGLATLPPEQIRLLHDAPQDYFRQRAEDALNPFAATLLPLEQDWLGFARFVETRPAAFKVQWQPDNGMLFSEHGGKTWVWLRAHLPERYDAAALQQLIAQTRAFAAQNGQQVLAGGGALFAAEAKTRAESESLWLSVCGLTFTVLLLWASVRNRRAAWLLLPVGAGMVCGLAAVCAVFGKVHMLTIVIGTGLIGVLVDFPLHWLAPALFGSTWSPHAGMRRVLPAFAVSLGVTAGGYALLWFTPLPVLQQTAVFSAAALCGAFAATVCFLPPRFHGFQARPTLPARAVRWWADAPRQRFALPVLAAVWLLCAAGIGRGQWQDDIRNWVHAPPQLTDDARRIAEIGGMGGGGQFIVVRAHSPDQLLEHNRRLLDALSPHTDRANVRSLGTWLHTVAEQHALKQRLRELAAQPDTFAPLTGLGVPEQTVREALLHTAAAPALTLEHALRQPAAEAWRDLYLGKIGNEYASLVYLSAPMPALPPDRHWQQVDKRSELNRRFADTRNRAAHLKLLSFALAWLLLWRLFGGKRGSLMLALPLASAAAVLGLLGWLAIPVGIFATFGLLLGSAVGLDYAAYALTAPESRAARLGGISLAAATTGTSFALLTASSTPAVAAFGFTVAASCAANWLAACLLVRHRPPDH